MINKRIIIDNVDVSGCKCYNPNIKMDCLLYPLQPDVCKNNPNCHYKLYKRKEQECERLKEQIKKHNDDMFKNPPEKRFYCKGCTLPYISKKFKATLTEIKEIAEKGVKIHDDIIVSKQILQKTSEVLNEKQN